MQRPVNWPKEPISQEVYKEYTEWPKISIVTPSYNQGEYIEETILSILNQNYPNIEYIIIDGGSNDNTVNIIKKYEDRIHYWISEPDNGQGHAINKGIAKCSGVIFNWINSDDFLEPAALYNIAKEYIKNQYIALCGCTNVLKVNTFSHIRKASFIHKDKTIAIANFNINQEGTWWDFQYIKKLNGVDENLKLVMDLDLWIRAIYKYPISMFRETKFILSNFRKHPSSKTVINNSNSFLDSEFFKEELTIFQKLMPENTFHICDFLELPYTQISSEKKYFNDFDSLNKRIISLYLFKLVRQLFYANKYSEAIKLKKIICIDSIEEYYKDLRYLNYRLRLYSIINFFRI